MISGGGGQFVQCSSNQLVLGRGYVRTYSWENTKVTLQEAGTLQLCRRKIGLQNQLYRDVKDQTRGCRCLRAWRASHIGFVLKAKYIVISRWEKNAHSLEERNTHYNTPTTAILCHHVFIAGWRDKSKSHKNSLNILSLFCAHATGLCQCVGVSFPANSCNCQH